MIRRWFKSSLARTLASTGAAELLGAARGVRRMPLIVGYHRVVEDFEEAACRSIPSLLISRRTFEQHLDWLGRRYRWVSLDELGTLLERGDGCAGKVAAVTFDDGYRDVYEQAFPILRRKGIPAAVFVVTDRIGTSRSLVHDRLYSLLLKAWARWSGPERTLTSLLRDIGVDPPPGYDEQGAVGSPYHATRLLLGKLAQSDLLAVVGALETRIGVERGEGEGPSVTWEMLAEMRAAGFTIGSHTKSHVVLTHETRQRVRKEIAESRQALEDGLGVPIRHFAYPDGQFHAWTAVAAAIAGYRFAYTTCRHRSALFPLLTVPRRVLWERSCLDARGAFSASVLACHANGAFDLAAPCRQNHGGMAAEQSSPVFRGRNHGACGVGGDAAA